jgi:hypothetical protein
LVLVGVLDEFVEFLAVEVEDDAAEVLLVDAVLEGEDEGDCLVEVALEDDPAEEVDLLAVGVQRDLSGAFLTPDSRSRVRKDSMQSRSFRYF